MGKIQSSWLRLKDEKTMERLCECGEPLTHHTRSGAWGCDNPECYVFNVYLKPVSKGKGFFYKTVRITYAAVL